jgi:CBS domain-containing protein
MLQKTIREFIRPGRLAQVTPEDSVASAIEVMKAQHAYCCAVVEGGRLVGVFTERDFLTRVTAERRPIAATRMRDVMTPEPVTLLADDYISYAINKMAVGGFRNVPIVDASGAAVAMLDTRDVVAHLSDLFDALNEQKFDPNESAEWDDLGGGA